MSNTVLDFIRTEAIKDSLNKFPHLEVEGFNIVSWGNEVEMLWMNNTRTLDITFFNSRIEIMHKECEEALAEKLSIQFICAHKTPKGYISSKSINVDVADPNDVTIAEVAELLKYNTDAIRNTFDPFWHENEAKRRNAIGWNAVAKSLQPDAR